MPWRTETDTNRRPQRRRFGFWSGVLATFGVLIALGILAAALDDQPWGDHIATLRVDGVIYDDLARDEILEDISETDAAQALIILINSPGGTTAGSEALFERLRKVASDKPVVAVMREAAASGGYITALGADHIIARGNTATGSIGVILEYPDVTGLMEQIGIGVETVRSSELKADGSPFRHISPAGRAAEQAMIDEGYAWFRDLVSERRGLTGARLDAVADGRVFSGRQALDLGLIDALGGIDEAKTYLESLSDFPKDLETSSYDLEPSSSFASTFFGRFLLRNRILSTFSRPEGPRLYSIVR